MKIKLIGMVLCVILITTSIAVAQPPQQAESTLSTETISSGYYIDVPVWEINDQWIYRIDSISINSHKEKVQMNLSLTIAELPLTVISTTGDFYTLEFQTSVSGQMILGIDTSKGPVNLLIVFSNIELSGNVLIEKSTLGIKELSFAFNKEKFKIEIEQPYIILPSFLQKFSTKITMNMTQTFNTPLSILTFPLDTGIFWNLISTNFTINGNIQSNWLNLLYLLNNIAKQFDHEFLPPKFSALLPIIDIKEALATLGFGNVGKIPAIPFAFICYNTENIVVPAGTYNAYSINLLGGKAQCYYAPTAGNVIKITGNFEEIIPNITNINMKLLSTNYS
jgi:hypothetical protein